ncbi:neuronal acetylcholine receptor subunit alpha-10-like [Saccostrea cucullata]|uniref:neuronal acetylcholine receptor subunit alpha-10-like n=1 Tax=Saccostrea cuccullata TaxID=36930 RepID=UPI002ED4859E
MSRDLLFFALYVLLHISLLEIKGVAALNVTKTDEQRLLDALMTGYSKDTRPVYNASHPVRVSVGITLTQIFDVDEKNQVLTTNVWLDQEWKDEKLVWDPNEYNGLEVMRIPCRKIWLPDIVLYNSASDHNEKYMEALAMVGSDGTVFWPPIVKFRSSCLMDMTYFPFDDQICKLKLGSWAYTGFQVDVLNRSNTIDMSRFVENGEWEIINTEAIRNNVYYTCCPEPFPDVTITLHLRRRTIYFMYNVIIPSIMLSSLALLGFWVNPDSGEKVTLGLTVLLALSVFMLLIAENTPATSFFIPLLGVYLITTMSFTSLSVICAVGVTNLHLRGHAYPVPNWMRKLLFLISNILCIRLHHLRNGLSVNSSPHWDRIPASSTFGNHSTSNGRIVHDLGEGTVIHHDEVHKEGAAPTDRLLREDNSDVNHALLETLKCLINKHEEGERERKIHDEWKEVALIIDRSLFVIFLLGMIVASVYILVVLPLRKLATV